MLKALRGTKDILPIDVDIWQHIESCARDIFARYGYREIRTPIIEDATLFIRSIGDTTDIVQKEMYVFSDRGGRTIALRPEATASIVRAYLEHSLGEGQNLKKLFYIGPMFRSERPQKGRQRQFHQLGVEAIGSDNPLLDVEVILLAVRFLERLGVSRFNLKINTLGCQNDKNEIIKRYKKKINPHLKSLCGECKDRYNKNVLRTLDCKNPACIDIIKKLKFHRSFCKDCSGHFEYVKKTLKALEIDFIVDLKLVRGLDYYTRTVFEITQEDLGSKDAVCAGGRYDDLVHQMGGKYTPSVGLAFGIERLMLSIKKVKQPSLDIFLAKTEDHFTEEAYIFMNSIREAGCSCDMDYNKRSLKAQMRKAERMGARHVVIFGDYELRQDKVIFRDMHTGAQRPVKKTVQDVISQIKFKKDVYET